jgi:hypothetical protein
MNHLRPASWVCLAITTGLAQPGHAQCGVVLLPVLPSSFLDRTTERATSRPPPPARPLARRDNAHSRGYGIAFAYRYLDMLSGKLELRRHDYPIDENLKGERTRNSARLTLEFRF